MSPRKAVHRAWAIARHYFGHSRTTGPIVLATIVGGGAGYGAVLFRHMVAWTGTGLEGAAEWWLAWMGPAKYAILPVLGGLAVGLIVRYISHEVQGPGVSHVMLSVIRHRSRMRARVSIAKAVASALCIGSGGSAGREGPIVQIGSALGSNIGQLLHLPQSRVRLLLGCGAAAATAATFNVPLAGTMFALEVILRDFGLRAIGLVVISSAAATAVTRALVGDTPAFPMPSWEQHSLVSPLELPLYALLGFAAALFGALFIKALYSAEEVSAGLRIPAPLKPALGGLLVGLVAITFPQVRGIGYESTEAALHMNMDIALCAILLVVKLAATSFTIGSGGSGGVFGPSLFMGAMLGAVFGAAVHGLLPDHTAPAGAYALVGMGALFAGVARAPVTAVLMLFEMTGDYRIILPLMCAVVAAALLSERLSADDIYTGRLRRLGVQPYHEPPEDPLDTITVEEVMTRQLDVVHATDTLDQLSKAFTDTGHHGFPVLDERDHLVGVVTLSDLAHAAHGRTEGMTVGEVATVPALVCHPDQSLREALRQVGELNVGRLPVVDRKDHSTLVGILRRHDIIGAYSRAASGGAAVAKHVSHPYKPEDDELD